MKNDVIMEIAGEPTPTLDDFARVLDDVRRDQPDVLLVYYRRGLTTGYAGLNLKIGENGKGIGLYIKSEGLIKLGVLFDDSIMKAKKVHFDTIHFGHIVKNL